MQSLLHHRMQEQQLITKIKNQEAVLRKKKDWTDDSYTVLENIKQLQFALSEKQLEIERMLNQELKKLIETLKK